MISFKTKILLLLFGFVLSCQNPDRTPISLYELKVFLLQGSNYTQKKHIPIFAGETSVRFIENVMKDKESLKNLLEETFGYQQIELLDAVGFLFLPATKKQPFYFNLDDHYFVRLIVLPDGSGKNIPLHVTLLNQSGKISSILPNGQNARDRLFTSARAENRIFSLRANVPLKKGMVLGKALPTGNSRAIFLLLQPREHHISTTEELKEVLKQFPKQVNIYGQESYRKFLQTVYQKLGQSAGEEIPSPVSSERETLTSDTIPNVVPFTQLTQRPTILRQINPSYPEDARRAGREGTVFISVLIDEQGKVLQTKLLKSSGTASLDSTVMSAARQFLFSPAEKNGKKVKVWMTLPFVFRLKKETDTTSSNNYRIFYPDRNTTLIVAKDSQIASTLFLGYLNGFRTAINSRGGELQKVSNGLQMGDQSVHYLIIFDGQPGGTFFGMQQGDKALFFYTHQQVYDDAESLRKALTSQLQEFEKIK